MSRFARLIIFIVCCAAIIGGLYYFLTGGPRTADSSSLRADTLFINRSNIVRSHASAIAAGWDMNELNAARHAVKSVETSLSGVKLETLDDLIAAEFIAKLDSCISAQYTGNMSSGRYADNPKLKKYYFTATAELAEALPQVKDTDRWRHIENLRSAHERIYAFGEKTYSLAPRIRPRFEDTPDGPRIRHDKAADVHTYRDGCIKELQSLVALRAGHPELERVPWTVRALSRGALDEKVQTAIDAYTRSERAAINDFLAGVNRHLAEEEPEQGYSPDYLLQIKVDILNLAASLALLPGGAGECMSRATALQDLIDRTYKK